MKKDLMKMLSKAKPDKEMSKEDIMAKMDVLKELLEMSSSKMGEGLKEGIQKVSVSAPDKEGLMMGLDKAKDVLGKNPDDMMSMMSEEDDEEEDEEEED